MQHNYEQFVNTQNFVVPLRQGAEKARLGKVAFAWLTAEFATAMVGLSPANVLPT